MVSSTVTAGNTATKPGTTDQGNKNVAVRPFVRSSLLHDEPIAYDVSVATGASTTRLPDIEVPASGYLRAIVLHVSTTSGAGTGVALLQDAPFNALTDITLQEPNGSQIAYWTNGYQLMVSNKFGAFFGGVQDPRQLLTYSTAVGTAANFSYSLRIPVEAIMRDALCALPNQNMAAKYRIKLNLGTTASIFSGTVSTPPTVRIRATLEGWEQPLEVVDGVPQATMPPLVNSTMFHTVQDFPIAASGQAQIPLTRLGNRIRQLTFIYTDAAGSRVANDAAFPDPLTIALDNRPIVIIPRYLWLARISKYWGYVGAVANTVAAAGTAVPSDSGGGRENGVWPLPFNTEFLGKAGAELGDLWLKTLTTSRLELQGNFGLAGRLTVITNDIALTGEL